MKPVLTVAVLAVAANGQNVVLDKLHDKGVGILRGIVNGKTFGLGGGLFDEVHDRVHDLRLKLREKLGLNKNEALPAEAEAEVQRQAAKLESGDNDGGSLLDRIRGRIEGVKDRIGGGLLLGKIRDLRQRLRERLGLGQNEALPAEAEAEVERQAASLESGDKKESLLDRIRDRIDEGRDRLKERLTGGLDKVEEIRERIREKADDIRQRIRDRLKLNKSQPLPAEAEAEVQREAAALESGDDLAGDLTTLLDRIRDKVKAKVGEVTERVKERVGEVRERVDAAREQLKERIDAVLGKQ